MQKNGIVKRIIEIGMDNGYTVSGLEKECEITRGVLLQAQRKDTDIGSYNLELFVKHVPKVTKGRKLNYEYLLLGKSPKYLNTYHHTAENRIVSEGSEQTDFEERMELALDNENIQKKLREVLLLAQ